MLAPLPLVLKIILNVSYSPPLNLKNLIVVANHLHEPSEFIDFIWLYEEVLAFLSRHNRALEVILMHEC